MIKETNEIIKDDLKNIISEKLSWVKFKNKNILIVGDISHSRVALSNIYALQLQGANVMVCGPKTLIPKYLHKLGVIVEHDFLKALKKVLKKLARGLRLRLSLSAKALSLL